VIREARSDGCSVNGAQRNGMNQPETLAERQINAAHETVEFARCFLRLANLPNFALDRLSRYEATLCRQACRILLALNALDRRKPQALFWYQTRIPRRRRMKMGVGQTGTIRWL
jgi:hypothetical protein